MVTRDSMGVILHITELLILEKFPKLLETTRLQVHIIYIYIGMMVIHIILIRYCG